MLTSCILKFETRKKIWRYRWCWLMLTSCISVDCSSISADKLHLNLCVWNREVWEPIVVCEVVEFHPHCLVSRYILFVPRICGLPTSSWKGWSLWKMWTWKKLGLTSDNMFNISKVAFWSPMLEVVVVPSEVEVDTVPPHDGQDLLAGGRDATVTTARVAGEVPDDNLPSIVPCLGKLTVQELFLWFGVVDVVIDGDGVHRHKRDRGCLQKIIEKEGNVSPVRWHWRNAPNRGSSILAQSRCIPLGTIPRLEYGGRGCRLSYTFKHNFFSYCLDLPGKISYAWVVVDVLPLLVELLIKGRFNTVVVDVVPGWDDEVASVMEAELSQGSGNLLLVNVAKIQGALLTGLPHFQYQREK